MGRKTHPPKSRRPQARRKSGSFAQEIIPGHEPRMSAPGLASLVKPDAICYGNPNRAKYAFVTEGKAAKALEHARANHSHLGAGKIEERYYECPYKGTDKLVPFNVRVDLTNTVTHYHLTSQLARPNEETS